VTATDLQLGFLTSIEAPHVEVIRHDVRTDAFPPASFGCGFVHVGVWGRCP
jgi:hypothetical protein